MDTLSTSPPLTSTHIPSQISRPPLPHNNDTPRKRYKIHPGVWSDGALSTDLPLVQSCLEQARLLRRIPPTPCIVFVLAALHVYTSYTDVAHWLFWGPRFKHETAKTVDFVLNHRGVTIKSPVSWIGVSENLFIIGAQQAAWRTKLTLMDWYKTLVTPPPAERRILRKRKAAPVSFEFDDGAELDLPNKKRPRTKRLVKPKSSSATTQVALSDPGASRETDAATMDLDDVQVDEDTSALSLGDQTSRTRTGKQPKTREESILSSLSSLSTTSSANHNQNTKAATRAGSEASEGTAVSSSGGTLRRRRSFSGSSAGTAIGVPDAKDGSATTPDNDEPDLKSSRTSKANNKRGRGRPKNK